MKQMVGLLVALVSLMPASSLAHHSLANFDTTTPVRVKGTIVQIHYINPHSFIYLEEKTADGVVRRWAAEGPAARQLERAGFDKHALKAGDVIEVCGYAPKENTTWQIASADPKAVSLAGRLLNAELMVMPDGQQRSWGDYGVHKCFAPGFRDQHSR
jgi:hypothetical protein